LAKVILQIVFEHDKTDKKTVNKWPHKSLPSKVHLNKNNENEWNTKAKNLDLHFQRSRKTVDSILHRQLPPESKVSISESFLQKQWRWLSTKETSKVVTNHPLLFRNSFGRFHRSSDDRTSSSRTQTSKACRQRSPLHRSCRLQPKKVLHQSKFSFYFLETAFW
jgi:hypothetical protein